MIAGLRAGMAASARSRHILPVFGAKHINDRSIADRNRIKGRGAKAGIDFGILAISKLLGEGDAKIAQLLMEYAPEPPFDCDIPELAGPALTHRATTLPQ
jgi:cyclohexyl-isocyanide hydratase